MAAVLPPLFLFISGVGLAAILPLREAVLKAAVVFGVVVALNTELLSLASLISPVGLGIAWIVECIVAAALVVRSRDRVRAAVRGLAMPRPGPAAVVAMVAVGFIVAAIAVTAVVAAPNTYDSMAFHMSRVAHWVADHSIAPYPTNIVRQLYEPPWSEFAILQLQVLSGGDQLASTVQWLAMCGCLVGVSRIAMQLGGSVRAQVFAVLFTVTLPMGILEASSTQTDYVEAFWLVCLVSFAFDFMRAPDGRSAAWFAAALGLAALTKGTAYVFAAPPVLALGVWALMRLRTRIVVPIALLIAIPLVLNAGQYVRNEVVFASPLSEKTENYDVANQTFAPNAIVSTVVRDSTLQFGTPSSDFNNLVDRAVVALHKYVLHISASDPRTTWPGETYQVFPASLDDDYAGDPLQSILAIAAIVVAFVVALRGGSRLNAVYAGCLVIAFVLFAAYLRWQPWHSRLELPLLVLASPLVGLYSARFAKPAVVGVVAALLVVTALPFALDNASRPLIGYTFPREAHYLDGGSSIFTASRLDVYFAKRHDLEAPYSSAAALARQSGCSTIGLWTQSGDWEYPLWVIGGAGMRVEQINVTNNSAQFADGGGTPCLLVVVVPQPPSTVRVGNTTFEMKSDENGVAIYLPQSR